MATPKLSIAAKSHLAFTLLVVVPPVAAYNIIRAAFRAWLQRLSMRASMWNGFVRALMTHVRPHYIQAVLPPTVATYRSWIRGQGPKLGISDDVQSMRDDDSSHLLWLGSRDSKKVVLFFHGGGYVAPLLPGHLAWMAHLRTQAVNAGVELSVCILHYSFIPDHPYPTQMGQAVKAVQSLLDSGYAPSDIIFGGDSAGGHLSLSLLSHLFDTRPDPSGQTPQIDLKGQQIKGCFVVSPLVSLDLSTHSYQERCSADTLCPTTVGYWGNLLTSDPCWKEEIDQGKGWGMALAAPEAWWKDVKHVVSSVLVTAGQEEIFRDHITQFIEVLRKTDVDLQTYIAPDEAHDGPVMDFEAKREPSIMTRKIEDWVISSFESDLTEKAS